jgi:hypothetical protein
MKRMVAKVKLLYFIAALVLLIEDGQEELIRCVCALNPGAS